MPKVPAEQRITVENTAYVAAMDQLIAATCEFAFIAEIEDALSGS